jgi:hypothetical protein
MSRRPTPWQEGRSAGTSRGLVTKLIQASAVLSALALATLVTFVPTAVGADTGFPVISYTIDGTPGTNDWYRGGGNCVAGGQNCVIVRWSVADAVNSDCRSAVEVDGPNVGTKLSCSASNATGTISAETKVIKIDADPPTAVVAAATRAPDHSGWYNHAFGIAWQGADATSGIASCTSLDYSGPDAAAANVSGGCTDNAGNSASSSFAVEYDATAPQLSSFSVQSTEGANIVHWKSSSSNDVAAISRVARGSRNERSLFSGPGVGFVDKKIQDGVEYRYSVRTYDQAGNGSQALTVVALPKVVSLGKKIGYTPRTAGTPILSWPARHGASYYHVQLFRNGKRILAAWPLTTELALHQSWRWAGRRYRLTPAKYAWFVWAGLGPRKAARYKLLGHSTFIVSPH